jgi:hypothetical protein
MSYGSPVTVEASSAKTVTGNGSSVLVPEAGAKVAVAVNVSAASGTTPTLDLKVQWSHDGGTSWMDAETADTFTQITAAKTVVKVFDRKAPNLRLVWTVGGTTPSFTFGATAYVTGS